MGKVGYIYIMTNESFSGHDWVKIGYSDNVELRRRQLSSTGLPYDYEIYATYELPEGVKIADKALHLLIQKLNANLRLNRNREFFEIKPEDAVAILKALAVIHGREDKVVLYKDNEPLKSDLEKVEEPEKAEEVSKEKQKLIHPQNASGVTFILKHVAEGIEAKMTITENGEFKVLAGSGYSKILKPSLHESKRKVREELEKEGKLKNGIFVEDVCFKSSSGAANQITGREEQGPAVWKTENGTKLAEFLKERNK